MRFAVPQFIDVEDKIFGPLTLKQAIYIIGSISISVGIFLKLGFLAVLFLGTPILLLAFLLAFIKIHGRPFVSTLYSATFYFIKNKLYLWRKTSKKITLTKQVTADSSTKPMDVNMTQSKLKKLAWTLDTKDTFYKNKKTH